MFGVTVFWSIVTTSRKACELLEKEKEQEKDRMQMDSKVEEALIENKDDDE